MAEGSRCYSSDVNLRYYSAHPHKLSELFTFCFRKIMRSLGDRINACDRSDVISAEQIDSL